MKKKPFQDWLDRLKRLEEEEDKASKNVHTMRLKGKISQWLRRPHPKAVLSDIGDSFSEFLFRRLRRAAAVRDIATLRAYYDLIAYVQERFGCSPDFVMSAEMVADTAFPERYVNQYLSTGSASSPASQRSQP